MPADSQWFDLVDAIVVGGAVVLVAALGGYGALSSGQRPQEVVAVVHSSTPPTSSPTPTGSAAAPVDVIATELAAAPIAAGITDATKRPVRSIVGAGYSASTDGYASAASKIDRDAALVVIVPSTEDAGLSALSWSGPFGNTIAAVEKAAPHAQILVVGPIVADAQAGSVKAGDDALRMFTAHFQQHYIDGAAHHWVGTRVDSVNTLPTADALTTAGEGIGVEVQRLLVD